jgi:tetratricopeptide (TPR) repeat protein
MYPALRLGLITLSERRKAPLGLFDRHVLPLRCLPWDLDGFLEMNNGRVLTIYDLGRFAMSIRVGLWDKLKQNRWGLVVAGACAVAVDHDRTFAFDHEFGCAVEIGARHLFIQGADRAVDHIAHVHHPFLISRGLVMGPRRVKLTPVMSNLRRSLKHILAASVVTVTISLPLAAQQPEITRLYERLREAEAVDSKSITRDIRMRWEQSGSESMDYLLSRGQDALERGETRAAVEHFSAVIDHAPNFAEAYHGRAQAYIAEELAGPALADLEQTLLINPHHFDALYGMGTLLEQLDKPKLAYETYALVLEMHPHYDEAKAARARLETRVKGREL